MAFTKKITIYTARPAKGAAAPRPAEQRTVWADVSQPGITIQYAAMTAGHRAEIQVKMRRAEYGGETHAVIDGRTYHITAAAPTENPLIVRLILEKGG